MAEKSTNKEYKQKEEAFVEKLKNMLDYEIQVMETTGQDKVDKKRYAQKCDLLAYATYRPAGDVLGKLVSDELALSKKEKRFHDYDNMNYYDIAEKLVVGYDDRIMIAKMALFQAQSKKSLAEVVASQANSKIDLASAYVVGMAKSQGVEAEIKNGFNLEVPNNITPDLVDKYLAGKEQSYGNDQ